MATANMLQLPVASSVDGSEDAWIVQGGTDKRTTLQSIADLAISGLVPVTRSIFTEPDSGLAGGGSLATDLYLSLDVENLPAKTTPTVADSIAMNNAIGGTPVKVTPPNFYKTIAGLTNKAIPVAMDQVVIYSIADSDSRSVNVADLGIPVGNVPTGGTTGQTIVKLSSTNFDYDWATLPVVGGGTGATSLTNHGVLIGQGTSAVVAATMTDGQLLIGQTGADPAATTVSGDVTISNLGVTAIGANKVTNGMLRQSSGLSVIGRGANTTGDVADITGTADQILRVSGTTLGFGSVDLSKAAAVGSSVLGPTNGGTGLASYTLGDIIYGSAANTLAVLSGNTASGVKYLSQTGTGVISAAPSWATISGGDITGAALTKVDDTNVTLTLGGSPTDALLRAASITAGWTGQLSLTRGGTNASLTASNGGVVYSDASALAILAGTATANLPVLSGSNTAPSWAAISYPGSATSGGVPYFSSTSAMASSALLAQNQLVLGGGAGAAPATLGSLGTTTTVLHGNAAGAPTFGAVSLTADVSGALPVANGGTNATSFTAYAVLCGGTTSTGALQSIASVGSAGNVLMSNGAAALPTMQGLNLSITFIIDGGGAQIATGIKGDLTIPFGCTITEWTLLADQSGSVVVDVWKDTYANYPPTNADSITGSAKPTITTATKGQSSTLTGWTTTIAAGDTLRFNVDSCTTITRVTLSLKVTRTTA